MTATVLFQNTNKVVLLAKLEVTEGVDPIPTVAANAFSVQALDIKANPVVLERANYSPSLSHDKIGIGRLPSVLTFTHELKASGTVGVAPVIGTFLQACGMAQTTIAAGATTQVTGVAGATNTGPVVTMVGSTAPTSTIYDTYRLLVTTGGASGTAKALIMSDGFPTGDATVVKSTDFTNYSFTTSGVLTFNSATLTAVTLIVSGTWATGDVVEFNWFGVLLRYVVLSSDTTNTILAASIAAVIAADARFTGTAAVTGTITGVLAGAAAPATLTTATPVTLGSSGAAFTPTWTGNLVVGDYYNITLNRAGVAYTPVSNNVPSLTFYVYLDGTLHEMNGCRGTFKIDGKASEYAKAQFTFTGLYVEPIATALPTGMVFEPSKPVKCELMSFTVKNLPQNFGDAWSLDIANTITQRTDYNAQDGWTGVLITARKPKLMCDPESMAPSSYNPWKRMAYADIVRVYCQIGKRAGAGNLVNIQADAAQFDKADYKNRTNIRTWDMSFALARTSDTGDNEFSIIFS